MNIQKKYLPIIISAAIALGIFIGGKLSFTDTSDRLFTSNSKKDKINRLIDYIDYEYVDQIDTDSIVDVTVNRILDNLDPHSTYIPKKDLQKVTDNMNGDYVGIGVSIYTYKDSATVIRALDGGPSKKAGIRGGDRIVIADGDSIFGPNWSNDDIVKKLKGEKNSKVNLKVYRRGELKLLDFKVKRTEVPLKSVDASYILSDGLGYIKINRFAESTFEEFTKGLKNLKNLGASKLVLDLRDNPGGYLNIAKRIADEFLEDDKLIVFTKNKKGEIEKYLATKKGDFETGDIYVLINENSASASEIIAGALQDNDKGTILGRRSYGKGLVQRDMALGDGSAVRLTVSRYYTPTGRSIQRSYDKGNEDYYHEYYKRIDNGELSDASNITIADSLKFTTPKGKVVYGGGGIIPDVFVPINKKMENGTISRIQASGIMDYFVFEDLDKNREPFKNMSQQDFLKNYIVSEDDLERFTKYLNRRTRYKITFVAYKEEVKLYLKATLAEQLYGPEAYVQVLNTNDAMLEKVKELVENN